MLDPLVMTKDSWIVRFYCFMMSQSTQTFMDNRGRYKRWKDPDPLAWDSCSLKTMLLVQSLKLLVFTAVTLIVSMFVGMGFWLFLFAILNNGVYVWDFLGSIFALEFQGLVIISAYLWSFASVLAMIFWTGFVLCNSGAFRSTLNLKWLKKLVESEILDHMGQLYKSTKEKYCKPVVFKTE